MLALDDFLVTNAFFPAHAYLPPHVHERASFATMLEGSFDIAIGHHAYACEPNSAVTEPAEERHDNRLGHAGAHVVGVHPDHLARAFRLRFGAPIGSYLRRLRLDWAAMRLETGDEGISAVALRAGFADQSHFTRTFKRHTGLTPQAYRRTFGRPSPF